MTDAVKSMVELKGLSFSVSEEKLVEVLAAVRARTDLPCPSRNEPPRLLLAESPLSRHLAIQAYIEAYEYNFTGENFFNVKDVRQKQSLFRVLDVAKRVIRESMRCTSASTAPSRCPTLSGCRSSSTLKSAGTGTATLCSRSGTAASSARSG
jgi:hypothetical protein